MMGNWELLMRHPSFFSVIQMKIIRTNETINKAKRIKDKGPIYQKETMPKKLNLIKAIPIYYIFHNFKILIRRPIIY